MHSQNTWGISGPVFLVIFATTSVACWLWAICDIYRARRIRLDDPIERLTPTEIGMLVSDRNAHLAALTQLLTQGYVDSDGRPTPRRRARSPDSINCLARSSRHSATSRESPTMWPEQPGGPAPTYATNYAHAATSRRPPPEAPDSRWCSSWSSA